MLLDTLRTARSRAIASRALVFGDHPRNLLAFDTSGRSCSGPEGRGFADWTQVVQIPKMGSRL